MEAKHNWMGLFTASVGAAVALFGAIVIIGWLVDINLLIQLRPEFGSVKFNNAAAYLALGIGLFGLGVGKNRLAIAGGTIAALLGSITLAQYVTGINLGIDEWLVKDRFASAGRPPGRMSGGSCWALLVSGVGALYAGVSHPHPRRDLILGISSVLTFGLGLSALFRQAPDTEELFWLGKAGVMSLQSAYVFLFVGSGLLLFAWQRSREKAKEIMPRWWPVTVGIAIVILTLVQWAALRGAEERKAEVLLRSGANEVVHLLKVAISERVSSITRQRKRYEFSQGRNSAEWDDDAANLIEDYPSFIAMLVTDASLRPLRVKTRPGESWDANQALDVSSTCHTTMKEAALTKSSVLLFSESIAGSDPLMYIASPLVLDDLSEGWILAVVDIRRFVTDAVGILGNEFGLRLEFADSQFFVSIPDKPRQHPSLKQNVDGVGYRGRWEADVWLLPEYAAEQRSLAGEGVLVIGCILAFLLIACLMNSREARRQALQAQDLGRKLQKEAEERTKAQESLTALFKVSRLLNSSLDLEHLMDMIAMEAVALTGADGGLARLRHGEELRAHKVYQSTGTVLLKFHSNEGKGVPSWVLQQKKPFRTDNALAEPQIPAEFKERFQPGALICMPLLDKAEEVLGFIQIYRSRERAVFTDTDLENIQALAGIASTAAQNALAYDKIWRTETELRKSSDENASLVEEQNMLLQNAADFIYRHDVARLITHVSGSVEKVTGYSRKEWKGSDTRFLSANPINEKALEHTEEALATGRAAPPYLVEIVHKDGRAIMLEVHEEPYFEKGRVAGLIGVARDVTERQKLQEQLAQSQQMEVAGQLAGGVAHDFNNILTVILGFSDFLIEDLDSDNRVRADLEQIREAALRGSDLTAQLLAFTRKQVTQPKAVNLYEQAKSLRKMLGRLLTEKIELTVEAEPLPWLVHIDPTQVQQILMNLTANAREAMPEGGKLSISISNAALTESDVRGWKDVEAGGYVRLRVKDTGTGMDARVRARVFEPFFTTKPLGKGTGLGLATCWGIVKQNGGHIAIESEVGHGTVFDIFLPRLEGIEECQQPPEQEEKAPGGSETVLVAEDDPSLRNLLVMSMRGLGYRVLEASNGEEAMAIAERLLPEPIHVLITDLVMPRMNGKVLSEKLAAVHREVGTIFMSGYADSLLDHFGEIDEMTNFLQKPFTWSSISQMVRVVLDAPRS